MKRVLFLCLLAANAAAHSWTLSTIDAQGDVGRYASIATRYGTTHVAYYDLTNRVLKYAFTDDDQKWTIETVDAAGDVGQYASIAVDLKGRPHISYYDATNHDLKYAVRNSGKWDVFVADGGNIGGDTSIAVDSAYVAHISYFSLAGFNLKYAEGKGANWITTIVDGNCSVGSGSSIALDQKGHVHISYHDNCNNAVKYATNASGQWVNTVVDSNDVGVPTSIATDSAAEPHIAYLAYGLKHAWHTANGWSTEMVDATIGVEQWGLSLALTSLDLPYISYHDGNLGHLKLAYQEAPQLWIREIVDKDNAGIYNSIALDEEGHIRIAYFANELRYAIAK